MYFFAMDLGWNRVPILLILLIFWKHAVGHKGSVGWPSQGFHPPRKGPVWRVLSPRGAQSSVLEAPVTGSIPFEEVASDVLVGKSLTAYRSQFSVSSSNESMSHTQSAPSASVSASMVLPQNQHSSNSITSLLQLQGSFSPSVQDIANQTGYQLVETSSPLSAQSSSSAGSSDNSFSKFTYTSQGSSSPQKAGSSQNIPGSSAYTILAASPLGVSQSTSGQNSYSWYTSGSQSRAGTQLAASRQYVPTSFQPEVATSQYASKFSLGTKVPVSSQYYPATQSGSSLSQGLQASSTVASQGFQTSGASRSISQSRSRLFSPSSASTLQLKGTSSQYAPASLDSKVPVYSQAAPSGSSLSLSQPSQLKPSTSRWSQDFQTLGTVTRGSSPSQGSKAPSRFSTLISAASPGQFASTQTGSTSTDGSSLLLQGTSSQYTPAALVAKVPVYNRAPPSGSVLSLSQPSQLKPSTSKWSQGLQASGTVASQGFQTLGTATSQSSSLSQGSKAPSRFSTLTSASPGQFASTQTGSTFTDGSSLLFQGTSSQYTPAALVAKVPVYSQAPPSGSSFSLSQPSQLKPSSWSQGFQASGTATSQSSSSQGSKAPSRFSTLTSAASPGQFASTQTGSTFTDGSSLLFQGTSSQYTPAALVAKVPVYSQAPPSGSFFSLSQPSQLKPSSWSQGFQASGTATSQSSSSQGSKAPSRFSTLTSAASPGQFASTQTGSTFTDGSSLLLQGTSSQYTPAALVAKVPVYNQAPPSGSVLSLSQPSQLKPSTSKWSQGLQASGTVASQGFQTLGTVTSQSSSLSQGSKAPSRFSTLISAASPGQFGASQEGSGRYSGLSSQSQSASSQYRPGSPAYAKHGSSLQLQGTSSQYTPAALVAKVPVYSQAPPSGSSFSLSQPSQLKPSTSRWSQGFQAFGTVTQGSSPSQVSKAPSRFSTLTSASPGQFASTQTGSTFTDGSSLLLQGTSSQYTPAALVAKVPVYNRAPPSGSSLSLSQPSQLKPSTSRWSQGFQASGTVTQGSSPSQVSKAPSRFSTLTSASPGQFASTQTGSTFTDGSSLLLQGTSSQYTPAALVAKVPVYNRAPPSGSSLSLSQPSQLKPSTSRWSQGFQASGTVTSQSSSSQGSKAPSRFSTLTSAASPGQFASTQEGSGRYGGFSRQSQSASSQYRPGSPAYVKYASLLDVSSQSTSDQSASDSYASLLDVSSQSTSDQSASDSSYASLLDVSSQSTSDQSASDSYASSSQSRTDTQLAGSSHYVPMQTGSTSTDGSSLQLQGTSSLYAPSVVDKVPVYSQVTTSGSLLSQLPSASSWSQGFQASGTAGSQSSSSPQTPQSSSAVMPALSPPVDSLAQSSQSQMSPGMFASVQHPTDSVTSSLGSNVQAALQGMSSGQSSDSTSVVSSRYASTDQKPLSNSRPSKSSSASGRYSSSVKG